MDVTPFISDEKAEKISAIFLMVFMLMTPIGELISEGILNVPYFLQPIVSGMIGCAGLYLVFEYLLKNRGMIKFCPSDLFALLLLVFACISFIFTTNMEITIGGDHYDEWLIHFIGYYSLMLAGTMINSNVWRKRIMYTFLAVGVIQLTVSVFQSFGMQISYCYFDCGEHTAGRLVYGLTQHNNFYVAIGILITGAFVGMAVFAEKKRHRVICMILSGVSFFCLLKTGTRISWIALAGLMMFYAVSFVVMRKHQNMKCYVIRYLLLLLFLFLIVVGMNASSDVLRDSIDETMEEQDYIKNDGYGVGAKLDAFGRARGYIWRMGLASVPKHWLTGIGLDNYASAFFESPEWHEGVYYQGKGHSEYIHTLVTQGVFATINYIAMLVYACMMGVRIVRYTEDEETRCQIWIFLGMFTGYVCQALVNSSVLNTAMYFWIVIGMIMPRKQQRSLHKVRTGFKRVN
ncbi:MAG: O-antigen ligase family protein [Lachnospiraceae bacterium]